MEQVNEVILAGSKTVQEWADEICTEWRKSVDGIINTGRLIAEALEDIKHGEKAALYESLPFSDDTAQRLVKVASDERIIKTAHARDLPASWMTLYELSKLDDDKFKQLEDAGRITPELERNEISSFFDSEKQSSVLATKHTGVEEHYTPEQFIESAKAVLGGIDLDPASNDIAQKTVKAKEYYTVDDDGLTKPWYGNVWMNPPYTALVINRFIEKFVNEFDSGSIEGGIILTNNNTDTSWFHLAAISASAICFTSGRINFLSPEGNKSQPTNGQSFFYFGDFTEKFISEFSAHGLVMVKA